MGGSGSGSSAAAGMAVLSAAAKAARQHGKPGSEHQPAGESTVWELHVELADMSP
jgi:hypothetical protein